MTTAIEHFTRMRGWSATIMNYFTGQLFKVPQGNSLGMSALHDTESVFVPVLPLLEAEAAAAGGALEEAKGGEDMVDLGASNVSTTPEGGVLVTLSGGGATDAGVAR